jgi:hypothetical protein
MRKRLFFSSPRVDQGRPPSLAFRVVDVAVVALIFTVLV